jgi:hypothetical protein
MGGRGSGNFNHRWRPRRRAVVEDCLFLNADKWTRDGLLRANVHLCGSWGWTFPGGRECSIGFAVNTTDMGDPWARLSFTVTQTGDWVDHRVRLLTTHPHFGGLRWWFVCPLTVAGRPCGRRVGKLYLPPRANRFGCRHCHRLTYTSCQESRKFDCVFRRVARATGMDFEDVKEGMMALGDRRW